MIFENLFEEYILYTPIVTITTSFTNCMIGHSTTIPLIDESCQGQTNAHLRNKHKLSIQIKIILRNFKVKFTTIKEYDEINLIILFIVLY